MKMTTKGKYAVSTMCELAAEYAGNNGHLQAKAIAGRYFMPEQYVEQILNRLKKAGLIRSIRGPKGGYTLSREPKKIKVGEIIEATEGPISLVQCVSENSDGKCSLSSQCKTKKFWSKLSRVIENVLDKTTLADIC